MEARNFPLIKCPICVPYRKTCSGHQRKIIEVYCVLRLELFLLLSCLLCKTQLFSLYMKAFTDTHLLIPRLSSTPHRRHPGIFMRCLLLPNQALYVAVCEDLNIFSTAFYIFSFCIVVSTSPWL